MPHLVTSVRHKIITQVSCGLDFSYALGQDIRMTTNVIDT